MWNSAWLEDVKWSFDAESRRRGELPDWNLEKTNYSDWTHSNDGAEELYDAVAAAVSDSYPPGYLLFRHFVGMRIRIVFTVSHFSTAHQRRPASEANRIANNVSRRLFLVLPLRIDTVLCTFWGG